MTQHGFFVDLSRCIGCNACVVVCKQWHDIEPGPVKWMRVFQWERGAFPNIEIHTLPIMCLHCLKPVCVEACPNQAISKEEKYGAVLVDTEKCTGEHKCFEACPYGTPQFASDDPCARMSKCNMCIDRLDQGLAPICVLSCSMRALEFGPVEELRKRYGEATTVIDKSQDKAPCRVACPAEVNVEGYIRLIAEGNTAEALRIFRESTPFAGILGRVCLHQCETECKRGQFDDPVPICSLKRYMADAELTTEPRPTVELEVSEGAGVAVIGSGPAGLAAAYDLRRLGYPVTVFESAPQAGGLMRYGIPSYRLPKDVLDYEISLVAAQGVRIRTSSPVKTLEGLFSRGYRAVFIATGAWQSQRLEVPGEDAQGVLYALDFLRRINSGETIRPGAQVVVIGGGSVAIDSARMSLRIGASEVHLLCLERRDLANLDRMPAQSHEILEAEREGVVIHDSQGVKRILTADNKVVGVEAMACVAVRGSDGVFAPRYDRCALSTLEADCVIVAAGQAVDTTQFRSFLRYASGRVSCDAITLEAGHEGVFVGGDMAMGAADIVSAIGSGKRAAVSIDRYLRGADLRERRQSLGASAGGGLLTGRGSLSGTAAPLQQRATRAVSRPMPLCARGSTRLDDDLAVEQAQRCLQCGMTVPSVVFKPEDSKTQIVPWDPQRTLELWQKRHPDNGERLPDVFGDISDVMEVPPGTYLRERLHLKPANTEELMTYTTDDE